LTVWADRSGAQIHSPAGVKDPAAVAYSSLEYAKAHKMDLVIVDTAGRLHTQQHLMEELKKVKRVLSKVIATAPHETLIVVDANTGQNAQVQAQNFHQALTLSGVILTKMDGTAKGGVVLGIVDALDVPVLFIGVGEAIEDLRPFSPKEFVESIV
jgi:fused signal recognition particle receptor